MEMKAPERVLVATDDFDEAVATMRGAFGHVDLRRDDGVAPNLSMRATRADEVAATRWALAGVGGGRLDQQRLDVPVFLTGIRLSGVLDMWCGKEDLDTTRPFLYPELIESCIRTPEVANLAVSTDVVLGRAAAMTGGVAPEFRFTGTAPLTRALDVLWRDTMVHAARTMALLAEHTDVALARTGLVDHVVLTMLHTFPNTALEAEERQVVGRAQNPSLRRALQFIDDHLDGPLSAPELAAAARLSLRGLHAMFRRELETTPMAYVRRARLDAARRELQRADAETADVADVARRWGFVQIDHFARRYRAAFGEDPVQTLRC